MQTHEASVTARRVCAVALVALAILVAITAANGVWVHRHGTRPTCDAIQPPLGAAGLLPQDVAVGPPGTSQSIVARGTVGFSAGDLIGMSPNDLGHRLGQLIASGASSIRFDISWDSVQSGGPQSWAWAPVDAVVQAASRCGLTSLPVLDYTPPWARPLGCTSDRCGPASPHMFASFASAAVGRYKSFGLRTWEIWNEPNLGWMPHPDVGTYSAVLSDASTAIHSVQHDAIVLVGGLAPTYTVADNSISPQDFVSALYQRGAGHLFGGVAVHPYSYPALPGDDQEWSGWTQMEAVHRIMTEMGDGSKGVWATEFGAPTNGPGGEATPENRGYDVHPDHVSENFQALFVSALFSKWVDTPWLRAIYWYNLVDLGTGTSTNENWFGLLHNDGSPKPSYQIWLNGVRAAKRRS